MWRFQLQLLCKAVSLLHRWSGLGMTAAWPAGVEVSVAGGPQYVGNVSLGRQCLSDYMNVRMCSAVDFMQISVIQN